jgi:hypothetical protein
MAFGQQSQPPATSKQVRYLESLVQQAGHTDFRDARGPLGLTQRQAGGKFTRDEASALIDQLLAAPTGDGEAEAVGPSLAAQRAEEQLESERVHALRGMPASLLADELTRRGWTVSEP